MAVSGQLILVSGLGSMLGPILGTSIMALSGINGLLYFIAAAAIFLAVVAGIKSLTTASPLHLQRPFKILAPQAVPACDPLDSSDNPILQDSM